jgi:Protein of unknown function (DUF3102)
MGQHKRDFDAPTSKPPDRESRCFPQSSRPEDSPADPAGQVAFDYSALDAKTAKLAKQTAEKIRDRERLLVTSIIETGSDLIRVKELLDHGQFGAWLRAEFAWAERTAQRYMRAAEHFSTKSDTVSDLPPSIVHQLAAPSTPAAVRDEIVSRLHGGERLPPDQIAELISEAKERDQEARAEAKLSPKQRKAKQWRKRKEEKERREALAELQADWTRMKTARQRAIEIFLESFEQKRLQELLLLMYESEGFCLDALAEAAGLDPAPNAEWRSAARARLDAGGARHEAPVLEATGPSWRTAEWHLNADPNEF